MTRRRNTAAAANSKPSASTPDDGAREAVAVLEALGRSQATIEFEPDGTILTANANFLGAMGYALDEVQGKHHRMFVDPAEAASVEYARFWSGLRDGEFRSSEFKRLAKGGREIWIQASYNPIFDEDGKVVKVIKFATDITEEKLKAADYEGQISALSKAQAVISFDPKGQILDANENFLATVGYSLEEIAGQHHRMFCEPELASSAEYRRFWAELAAGEHKEGEFKRLAKGGRELWLQATYNPIFDPSGRVAKVVKFASDITEHKLKAADDEGQLSALSKAQAVISFDPSGKILDANENFLTTTGYTLDEIVGQHHRMFCEPALASSREYAQFWADLARGEYQDGAFKRVDKSGNVLWLQASYNPIVDPSGSVYKVVKFATDITRSRLEAERAKVLESAVRQSASAVMMVDKDLTVTFVNDATRRLFSDNIAEFRKPFPTFDPEKIVGTCIDIFHRKPAHQRAILADRSRLPLKTEISVGSLKVALHVSGNYNAEGEYIGNTLEWADVTEAHRREEEAEELRRKVDAVLETVAAAAKGDLTREVTVQGADAIGRVGGALSELLRTMRESVGAIAENANKVGSAADQLTSVSGQMTGNAQETTSQADVAATATEQVNANVQTVAAATEEMSASIQEIAKNAADAARVATSAVTVADTTNNVVTKLGESSADIGKVIKVITSIAQQTNLLALNATIEAARAGEAGKGFAVVANEVKELAKETAKATEDIGQRIETIQSDTASAVDAIGQISEIIGQINDLQGAIAAAVEEQTSTTNEISRNVSEAARGSAEISSNISAVAEAAQNTLQGSSDTQESAGGLSAMAAELRDLVGQFQY